MEGSHVSKLHIMFVVFIALVYVLCFLIIKQLQKGVKRPSCNSDFINKIEGRSTTEFPNLPSYSRLGVQTNTWNIRTLKRQYCLAFNQKKCDCVKNVDTCTQHSCIQLGNLEESFTKWGEGVQGGGGVRWGGQYWKNSKSWIFYQIA